MKQETLNRPENAFSNISFQQKSTALSLIIIGSATAYYFANMWPMRPVALANDIIPAGYGSLLLTTMGLIIVAEIILQIVLTFGAGSASDALAHHPHFHGRCYGNAGQQTDQRQGCDYCGLNTNQLAVTESNALYK